MYYKQNSNLQRNNPWPTTSVRLVSFNTGVRSEWCQVRIVYSRLVGGQNSVMSEHGVRSEWCHVRLVSGQTGVRSCKNGVMSEWCHVRIVSYQNMLSGQTSVRSEWYYKVSQVRLDSTHIDCWFFQMTCK